MIADAVFDDFRRGWPEFGHGDIACGNWGGHGRNRGLGIRSEGLASQGVPSARLLEAFELARRNVVALIDAANFNAVFRQYFYEQGKYDGLQSLHAIGERLGDQHVVEAVYHEPAKAVRFRKNHAAGRSVVAAHNGDSMLPSPVNFALPKRGVERVVGVS